MTEWMAQRACVGEDPELFFPLGLNPRPEDYAEATEICGYCPVRTECRAFADRVGAFDGVWGGELRNMAWRKRQYRERAKERVKAATAPAPMMTTAATAANIERGAQVRAQVTELTAAGMSCREIGDVLGIHECTVQHHRTVARRAGVGR